MPTKNLTSPLDRNGDQRLFKFGGGANTITTENGFLADPADPDSFEFYSIGYSINAGGGNDSITGSDIGEPGSGVGDTLIGGTGSDSIIGGFGDDIIKGGTDDGTEKPARRDDNPKNVLIGDTDNIIITAGNTVAFGYDTISGGNGINNSIYGDNFGNVSLGAGSTFIGGNDVMRGGDGLAGEFVFNLIVGDTQTISGSGGTFVGGDDTLIGGDGVNVSNEMIGDTGSTGGVGAFTGGDDTFIGGEFADDTMTGDWFGGTAGGRVGGADTFVIGPNGARDVILDFRPTDQSIRDDGTGTDTVIITDETVVLTGFTHINSFEDLTGRWCRSARKNDPLSGEIGVQI